MAAIDAIVCDHMPAGLRSGSMVRIRRNEFRWLPTARAIRAADRDIKLQDDTGVSMSVAWPAYSRLR
jgi:hypothetical protein